jgi:hypothetical protein
MDLVIIPNRFRWLEKNRDSRKAMLSSLYFLVFKSLMRSLFFFSNKTHTPGWNDVTGRQLFLGRDALPKSIESWGLLEKGFNYDVVAVFGSQSTGKSKFNISNITSLFTSFLLHTFTSLYSASSITLNGYGSAQWIQYFLKKDMQSKLARTQLVLSNRRDVLTCFCIWFFRHITEPSFWYHFWCDEWSRTEANNERYCQFPHRNTRGMDL